jgi:hypothetical protein
MAEHFLSIYETGQNTRMINLRYVVEIVERPDNLGCSIWLSRDGNHVKLEVNHSLVELRQAIRRAASQAESGCHRNQSL